MKAVLALSCLLLAAPALAQPSPSESGDDESASETQASSGNRSARETTRTRRVCRTIAATGSRMSTERVCMTAEEWRAYDRRDVF